MEQICLGIDLGTSNSCISQFTKQGESNPSVIPNKNENSITTPSWVLIKDKEVLIGEQAKKSIVQEGETVFYGVKRLIGRKYDNIKDELDRFTYKIIDKKGYPILPIKFRGEEIEMFPEHISALVLADLYRSAEIKAEKTTNNVVITVPANFNDYQRRATIDAGKSAGLNVLNVISEPTAAALYYVYDQKLTDANNKKVLVYDFGGGTLDVSLVQIKNNEFTILATSGDTRLGGFDIDNEIMNSLRTRFKNKFKIDIYDEKFKRDKALLQYQVEEAKIALSSTTSYKFIASVESGTYEIEIDLNRAFLEMCCDKVFEKITVPIKNVLAHSKLTPTDIDDVIMVGGSSAIPYVIKKVSEIMKKEVKITVNPDTAISLGAALYGAVLCKTDIPNFPNGIILKDVTPMNINIATAGNKLEVLIPKNVVRPAYSKWNRYTTSRDNQKEIAIKIYEGDSPRPSLCYLVGEFAVSVEPKRAGEEFVFARVEVTDEKISIYASKEDPTGLTTTPLLVKVQERKDAHTPEEMVRMKNDIRKLMHVQEEPIPPYMILFKFIRSFDVKTRKLKGEPRKRAKALITEFNSWIKNHQEEKPQIYERKQKDFIEKAKDIPKFYSEN